MSKEVAGLTIYGWKSVEESDLYSVFRSSFDNGCRTTVCPGSSPVIKRNKSVIRAYQYL